MHLPSLTLYFPSPSQTLQLILVHSLRTKPIELAYQSQSLCSPSMPLTRARVGKLLGPTYASSSGEKLRYPGVEFELRGGGGREDAVESLRVLPREGGETSVLSPVKGCVVNVSRVFLPRVRLSGLIYQT